MALAVLIGGFTAAEGLFTRTYVTTRTVVQPVRSIEFKVLQGDVRVLGTSTPRITITRRVTTSLGDPVERVTTSGDRLKLVSTCEPSLRLCRTDYEIRVPRRTSLHGKIVFGDGTVRGLDGPVDLKVRRGGATVDDVHGSIALQTGSGDLVAGGLDAASVSAISGSGDVLLNGGRFQQVVAYSRSGDVTVRSPRRFASVQAGSATGDVTVLVPDTTEAYHVSALPEAKATLEVPVDDHGPAIRANSGSGAVIVRPS